jgi:hypothetical protein
MWGTICPAPYLSNLPNEIYLDFETVKLFIFSTKVKLFFKHHYLFTHIRISQYIYFHHLINKFKIFNLKFELKLIFFINYISDVLLKHFFFEKILHCIKMFLYTNYNTELELYTILKK